VRLGALLGLKLELASGVLGLKGGLECHPLGSRSGCGRLLHRETHLPEEHTRSASKRGSKTLSAVSKTGTADMANSSSAPHTIEVAATADRTVGRTVAKAVSAAYALPHMHRNLVLIQLQHQQTRVGTSVRLLALAAGPS